MPDVLSFNLSTTLSLSSFHFALSSFGPSPPISMSALFATASTLVLDLVSTEEEAKALPPPLFSNPRDASTEEEAEAPPFSNPEDEQSMPSFCLFFFCLPCLPTALLMGSRVVWCVYVVRYII